MVWSLPGIRYFALLNGFGSQPASISLGVEWPGLDVALPLVVYSGIDRDAQYTHNMV